MKTSLLLALTKVLSATEMRHLKEAKITRGVQKMNSNRNVAIKKKANVIKNKTKGVKQKNVKLKKFEAKKVGRRSYNI